MDARFWVLKAVLVLIVKILQTINLKTEVSCGRNWLRSKLCSKFSFPSAILASLKVPPLVPQRTRISFSFFILIPHIVSLGPLSFFLTPFFLPHYHISQSLSSLVAKWYVSSLSISCHFHNGWSCKFFKSYDSILSTIISRLHLLH